VSIDEALSLTATAVFAVAGCWLAVIDVRTHRLPNRQVAGTGASVLALLTAAAAAAGSWGSWGRALLAAAGLVACYFVLAVVSSGGVGMGDVKLAAVVGLTCGWHSWAVVVISTVATFVLAAGVGIGLLVTRRATRTSSLAFGPFMVAGALLALTA